MAAPKILVTRRLPEAVEARLRSSYDVHPTGIAVVVFSHPLWNLFAAWSY